MGCIGNLRLKETIRKIKPQTATHLPTNATIVPKNPAHNVVGPLEQATQSLSALATVYLTTEAAGYSQATLDAKRRDLQRFLSFYQNLYTHDRLDAWFVSVTKAFLKALSREHLAQASLARIYATVRHFARWLHQKFPDSTRFSGGSLDLRW